jgi:glycosyltransferase involved in cell wall biosynthesis
MRILHLYKDYHPVVGGIENHVKWLAEEQSRDGHEVTVLVCGQGATSREQVIEGVRVMRAGRLFTMASMPVSLAYPYLLSRLEADIGHVHLPFPLGAVANLLLGRTTATVVTYHCDIVRQRVLLRLYSPLLHRVLRSADAIITTSPSYAETSPRLAPLSDRCTVIPLGIDTARFAQRSARGTGLLFVGRLRYYKRLDTLLRAMVFLPEVRLTVVGEGPMRSPWERLSSTLGLDDRVDFVGAVTDAELPRYYAEAALFVLPAGSRAEAFGTVLLEAMASALPVVSTELDTGTSWVNRDGVTGRVVPPDDPVVMADVIRQILADETLQLQMGAAALRRVNNEFTLRAMVERVEEVYTEVLKRETANESGT